MKSAQLDSDNIFKSLSNFLQLTLTPVCDDPKVRFDDLHVDTVLLLSDNHRSPQSPVICIPILSWCPRASTQTRIGRSHRRVIWTGERSAFSMNCFG